MMLTARFQSSLQAATVCKARRSGRAPALKVVAFKSTDEEQTQEKEVSKAKVTFQLPMHVEWGQEVALVGAVDSLGNWDVQHCLPMSWNDGDVWTTQAELPTNTTIEYKYIIRAGEGEEKDVVEWQPCNNLELQAEQPELTIRDGWEGQQHEVLPGTLPVPTPPAVPDTPPAEAAAAEAPAAAAAEDQLAAAAAAPEVAAPAVAVVEEAAPAAAVAADGHDGAKPESPAAAVAAAVRGASSRRNGTSSRSGANGSKPAGGNSSRANKVVAAAAAAVEATAENAPQVSAEVPFVRYGSLTTSELKEVCKERGLSTKGQRRDLLARLQQLLQQQGRSA